jgi:HEAT repeat protein
MHNIIAIQRMLALRSSNLDNERLVHSAKNVQDELREFEGVQEVKRIYSNSLKQNKVGRALTDRLSIDRRWMSALIILMLSIPYSLALAPNSWSQERAGKTVQGQLESPDIQKSLDSIKDLAEEADGGQEKLTSESVSKELSRYLQNPSLKVRRMAVDALTGIGIEDKNAIAVKSLVGILQDQKQPLDLRRSATLAIRSIDPKPAVKSLIKALDDTDPGIRSLAADALGSIEADAHGAVDKLSKMSKESPDPEERESATKALGNIDPTNKKVRSTLNQALTDSSWRVRSASADILAKINPQQEDITPLIKALKNQNSTLRTFAAIALGVLEAKAKEAVPHLQNALQTDHNPYVRAQAATALGKILADNHTTLLALTNALSDQDDAVRSRAFDAFYTIAHYKTENLLAQSTIKSNELQQTIKYFDDALVKINLPKSGLEAKKNTFQPDLNRLNAKKNEKAFINIVLQNPWAWGIIAYLALHFGLFWLRPLWLLKIDEVLKPLSLRIPILGMEISSRFLLLLKFHPRVLDAWVAAHIQSVQEEFQKIENVEARKVYIPSPAILNGRTVPQITSQDLRSKFDRPLLIWGEGGIGKTSLSCQIAQWAMAEQENERLCQHRMLPILIEEDFDCEAEDCKQSLLDAILGQLRILSNEEEPISEELLERLLRRRRILVIVDHLSEMNEQTRKTIDPEKPDFPINALIVTSRQEEKLGRVNKTTIKPLRIMGNRLSSFMEAYLMQQGKRDLFTDSEFFDSCSHLSRMVGQREVTAMLATLYAKQLITAKLEALKEISGLPDNIPELMISYLNELNRDLKDSTFDKDKFDDRTVHQDAKAVAWACVQEMYHPSTIRRETAIAALAAREEKAEEHLQYLEERLHLIQTVGATKDHLRFTLDPLAEYLAGLQLIDTYKANESQWLEFLKQAQTKSDTPATISGFLGAVEDCLASSKEAKISPQILTNFAQILNKDTQATAFVNTLTVNSLQLA